MLEALQSIVSAVGVAMSFIVSFFQGIISFVVLIGQSLVYLKVFMAFLPLPLEAFCFTGILVAVVLRLIGR